MSAGARSIAGLTSPADVEVLSPGAPAEANFFLGEAYTGQDYREARNAYRRYLELEPSASMNPELHPARRSVRRGLLPENLQHRPHWPDSRTPPWLDSSR